MENALLKYNKQATWGHGGSSAGKCSSTHSSTVKCSMKSILDEQWRISMYNRQFLEGVVCDFAIRRKTYIEYINIGRQASLFSCS